MKTLLLILLLLAGVSAAEAQITPIGGKKSTTENLGGLISDSTLTLPKKYATSSTYKALDSTARLWYDMATTYLWYHDGTSRQQLASATYVNTAINNSFANLVKLYNYKMSNVNATTVGNYLVATTLPDHGRFIVTAVLYVYTSFSGTITLPPSISFGFTPTAYTDILGPIALASSPVVNTVSQNSISNKLSVPANTQIFARISPAATFTTTGTYTLDVYVQGYYEIL